MLSERTKLCISPHALGAVFLFPVLYPGPGSWRGLFFPVLAVPDKGSPATCPAQFGAWATEFMQEIMGMLFDWLSSTESQKPSSVRMSPNTGGLAEHGSPAVPKGV